MPGHPYGVDVDAFKPGKEGRVAWRQRLGIPTSAKVILSVAAWLPRRLSGVIPQLRRLLERNPSCHLVLAGGGDRLEEFRRAASGFAARVHFPGVVLRQGLPSLYRAADVFVLPAVHDGSGNVDGLPNVILEAMASGLPVVASGISGIPLAVGDGVTGLLVAEKEERALYNALERLLRNPEEARELGAAGRRKTEEELTWDAVAARYRMAYRQALTAPDPRIS